MEITELYKKGRQYMDEKKIDFLMKGVETEFVLANNEFILEEYLFNQKAINTIGDISTGVTLLDIELQVPIIMSSMNAPIPSIREGGLLMAARALKDTGAMMWTGSPVPKNMKELAATGVPLCQTVKPIADRQKCEDSLKEAVDAGYKWVGIEVDAGQCTKVIDKMMTHGCTPMSVEEIREMKERVGAPFVLKGILSAWDAQKALEAEADLIVVSNHGAHTIDYLPHPFQVMDEIHRVIGGRIPIIVDSGFRRGTDVLKGLAMGADAVGLGRPILWALAADGEEGVRSLITEMRAELVRAMTMTGVEKPADAHPGILINAV